MLYTFSQAHYSETELQRYLTETTENDAVVLWQDGVLNLLDGQHPELLLQKDFIRTFKLLDLYDIEQRFVCANSLDQYNLQAEQLIISAEKIDRTSLINKLSQAEKVFTF